MMHLIFEALRGWTWGEAFAGLAFIALMLALLAVMVVL